LKNKSISPAVSRFPIRSGTTVGAVRFVHQLKLSIVENLNLQVWIPAFAGIDFSQWGNYGGDTGFYPLVRRFIKDYNFVIVSSAVILRAGCSLGGLKNEPSISPVFYSGKPYFDEIFV
jgi:hypothetical protein